MVVLLLLLVKIKFPYGIIKIYYLLFSLKIFYWNNLFNDSFIFFFAKWIKMIKTHTSNVMDVIKYILLICVIYLSSKSIIVITRIFLLFKTVNFIIWKKVWGTGSYTIISNSDKLKFHYFALSLMLLSQLQVKRY